MAGSVSPATGRRYGVARVCAVWDVPRSSFYLARRAAQNPAPACPEGRRGPKPAVSDADLLGAIRADLARSPWSGEGHRKVWARLRVHDGLRVARKRVLRLMRENALLSPHRARPRPVETHDRRIVTDAPNLMWAIDGTQIATVQDGKVWLFAVAEHWNAEALGWHVSKRGTRREALQAMGMAVRQQHGHLGRDAARGVQLRHDHGSCFMAEDFQTQIRAWGMTPSYAFVGQPQTNGVIERFFRTLKEQVVHGRVFQTLEDVRDAVRIFVARYNAEWLVEKNAHLSPHAMRRQHGACGHAHGRVTQPSVQGNRDRFKWKSARTTNAIERLHEEFKRRIKTQTVLPDAETAPMLFWALLASGQIVMRKVDGWDTLAVPLADQAIDLAA